MSEAEVVEGLQTRFGPAKGHLEEAGQAAYRRDLEALWRQHDRAFNGTVAVESEFPEIIANVRLTGQSCCADSLKRMLRSMWLKAGEIAE